MSAHLKGALSRAGLLTTVLSLLGFTIGLAASGDLDTTFSGDGKVTTGFTTGSSYYMDMIVLQPDGKILAIGERYDPSNSTSSIHDFALARYNMDGSLDNTFSGDGKLLTNFGAMEYPEEAAVQSDGKIVVAGDKCNAAGVCDLLVARYNRNGTLDTTFSGDGKLTVSFGPSNGGGGGIAIRSDAKIVIGGWMVNSHGDSDFAVYRLNPNGTLDTTFSGDGKVNGNFGPEREDVALDLVQYSGKVLVVGRTCDVITNACDFALLRMTSNAALDTTFAGDGTLTTNFGASEQAFGVARRGDGKIVVGGKKCSGGPCVMAAARYNDNGTLDTMFSGDGKQTVNVGTSTWATDVVVQGDGKAVLGGCVRDGAGWDFALARLLGNGNLDTTFSGDGKARVDFGGHEDCALGIGRQSNGRYVLGGYTYDGTQDDFAIARILP